jgi:hypothetical protein
MKDALLAQIDAEYNARDQRIKELDQDEWARAHDGLMQYTEEEKRKNLELHKEKVKMQADLLEGEKKLRFEYEQQIADLQRRLAEETDNARKKDLQDMMKLAAEQFGKALAAQVQPILDQFRSLQSDNSNTVYSLNQVVREIRAIRGII